MVYMMYVDEYCASFVQLLKGETSGIPGGYRLVSTYDLPDFPKWGGGIPE